MKMNKKRNFFASALIAALVISVSSALPVSAATYEYQIERGVQNLCYSRDTVTFTYANGTISSSNGRQARSGVLVNLKGIPRYSASSTQHVYDAKKELLVGAVFNGVTLGWARDVRDRMTVTGSGGASVRWDI